MEVTISWIGQLNSIEMSVLFQIDPLLNAIPIKIPESYLQVSKKRWCSLYEKTKDPQ